jgi:osmotically-inducible protein OsmY/sporulation protein YlmC with PRC-barrel domain
MATARLEIKFGAPVEATDGSVGRIQQVMLHSGDKRMTALVVRRGVLLRQHFVVPIEAVAEVTASRIRLNATVDEVLAKPIGEATGYLTPAVAVAGPPLSQPTLFPLFQPAVGELQPAEGGANTRGAVIYGGQRVECADGYAGKVKQVLGKRHPCRATHFVIRRGRLRTKEIMVPVEWIDEFHPDHLRLKVELAALARLPEYRSDRALQVEITRRLWSDKVIRTMVSAKHLIRVEVRDGAATVGGHARTDTQRARIDRITKEVPGVLAVENHVVADDRLELMVIQALANDSRTQSATLLMSTYQGYVNLAGDAASTCVRDVAEEVVGSVPGVRGVVNRIRTLDQPMPSQHQRIRQPGISRPVYSSDNVAVGQVEQVVISLRSRLVTDLIVRGELPDPVHYKPDLFPDEWRKQRRTIVVPVEQIALATIGGVFLKLTALEVAGLADYDPTVYVTPATKWETPFPYRREDVLLDASKVEAQGVERTIARRDATWSARNGYTVSAEQPRIGLPNTDNVPHIVRLGPRYGGIGSRSTVERRD